jgi:TonB family protein
MKLKESGRVVRTLRATAAAALLSVLAPWCALAQDSPPSTAGPRVSDAKVAGQDVPVPARKKYVAPQYPAEAAAQGIRGIVILEITIGEDGRVLDTRVTRSIPGLDEAAARAVRLWEYEVTRLAGRPVKVILSQSITFALKLPDLQREVGVPDLKSGGAPPIPASLATPETASVEVTLGSQGEVSEAAVVEGNSVVSEALLRAVKTWRFAVSTRAAPISFTIRAEWTPGPQPMLVLKAFDLKPGAMAAIDSPPLPGPASPAAPTAAVAPLEDANPEAPSPAVDTEVLPARPEPPVKETGVSAVADVALGDNIPDLVKGRRPVWPPLARLGNITGDVVVRFSVDLAGRVTVHSAEGPDMLKDTAEQAVGTWLFRRTAIDRVNLIATFKFGGDRSTARVERVE